MGLPFLIVIFSGRNASRHTGDTSGPVRRATCGSLHTKPRVYRTSHASFHVSSAFDRTAAVSLTYAYYFAFGTAESLSPHHLPPNQYMSRPGSSLGIAANPAIGVNAASTSSRPRRVTVDEKYRQEKEREADLEGELV